MKVVVGVGCSLGCTLSELQQLIDDSAGDLEIVAISTVDRRAQEPCVIEAAAARGVPLRVHAAASLAKVPVPTPSALVAKHVGTPSVAEASALLSVGAGAELVVAKRRSEHATCAVARWPG